MGDIIALSQLAVKVYTSYKDAPSSYKTITEEVKSLRNIITKAALHFSSTSPSENDRKEGQEALEGCQSVLGDLNSIIERYKSLSSPNT